MSKWKSECKIDENGVKEIIRIPVDDAAKLEQLESLLHEGKIEKAEYDSKKAEIDARLEKNRKSEARAEAKKADEREAKRAAKWLEKHPLPEPAKEPEKEAVNG